LHDAQHVVTPNMRVADIAGALDYLATRPDVVKGRIGIIGHSHGGSTVIRSAQKNFGLAQRGLAAGVAYLSRLQSAVRWRHRHSGSAAGRRQG
jgi:dienelactone hydrolase